MSQRAAPAGGESAPRSALGASPPPITSEEPVFHCPGELQAITPAVHYARLAAHHAACGGCEFRHHVAGLPPAVARRLAERRSVAPFSSAEGLAGLWLNDITPARARDYAAAFATALFDAFPAGPGRPSVVLGHDERPLSAELVAAASEGLRWVGADVIDLGPIVAPALVMSLCELGADGGLLLGNAPSTAMAASLKLWGRGGRPWSSPGTLDTLPTNSGTASPITSAPVRRHRTAGRLHRRDGQSAHVNSLHEYFHALRPLSIVVDTVSAPALRDLIALARPSACRLLRPMPLAAGSPFQSRADDLHALSAPGRQSQASASPMRALRESIVAQRADLGLWIDGDGESLCVFDERARPVPPESVLMALCRESASRLSQPECIVLEADATSVDSAWEALPCRVERAVATREAMFERITTTGARWGGGASGRLWHCEATPRLDALLVVSLLLRTLSTSDAPASALFAPHTDRQAMIAAA